LHVIDFQNHVARELVRASYTRERRRLRRATLILGELTCVALLVSLFTGRWWGVAGVLGAATLASAAGLVYYRRSYRQQAGTRGQLRAGLRGQELLAQILAPLDDRYNLLNNLSLPGWSDDVDHVLVGPNGVFVLETKHHRGRIFCRDGAWLQQKVSRGGHLQPEEPMRDPVRQLKRNVDYLRACIRTTDPSLARRTGLWMEGAAVFTHPGVTIDLPPEVVGALPFPVLRGRDLPAHITGHVPRPYSRSEVSRIVSLFGHLKAPEP
jgi:hypothetical protein